VAGDGANRVRRRRVIGQGSDRAAARPVEAERVEAGPGQESVWDYPRPPRVEEISRHLKVVFSGVVIAETERGKRVLETSHPPVYYIPPGDVNMKYLEREQGSSYCEWKGRASYFDVIVDQKKVEKAAWSYPEPTPKFKPIAGHLAFYPHKMDACYVGDEQVEAQKGGFYGGWITSRIVGPFKGEAGTAGW